MTESTGVKQRGGRFRPGQSGNPAGRPKGSRHRTTILAEKLMADDAEKIVQAVVTSAREGDLTAAKLVLDRICPARKDSTVDIELPVLQSPADAIVAMQSIMAGVSRGDITPGEAMTLSGLVDVFVKTLEAHDFEARLARLEETTG